MKKSKGAGRSLRHRIKSEKRTSAPKTPLINYLKERGSTFDTGLNPKSIELPLCSFKASMRLLKPEYPPLRAVGHMARH